MLSSSIAAGRPETSCRAGAGSCRACWAAPPHAAHPRALRRRASAAPRPGGGADWSTSSSREASAATPAARASRARSSARPTRSGRDRDAAWSRRSAPVHVPATVGRSWVVTPAKACCGYRAGLDALEEREAGRQQAAAAELVADAGRHGAKVLADDHRAGAMRLRAPRSRAALRCGIGHRRLATDRWPDGTHHSRKRPST